MLLAFFLFFSVKAYISPKREHNCCVRIYASKWTLSLTQNKELRINGDLKIIRCLLYLKQRRKISCIYSYYHEHFPSDLLSCILPNYSFLQYARCVNASHVFNISLLWLALGLSTLFSTILLKCKSNSLAPQQLLYCLLRLLLNIHTMLKLFRGTYLHQNVVV